MKKIETREAIARIIEPFAWGRYADRLADHEPRDPILISRSLDKADAILSLFDTSANAALEAIKGFIVDCEKDGNVCPYCDREDVFATKTSNFYLMVKAQIEAYNSLKQVEKDTK